MNVAVKPEKINVEAPLAGKLSLVTGSTSGIGLGIARALAAAGSDIVLNGFGKPDDIAQAQANIASDFKVRVAYFKADMSKPLAIREMIEGVLQSSGRLDILVNNAGIQHVAPLQDFPPEKWDAILAINLSSAFHTTRLVLPAMLQNKWGRIINIASTHGLVASPFKSAYVAAKHGIIGLTKVTADCRRRHHLQRHLSGLRVHPAGRGSDRGAGEGARHPAGTGYPRRATRAAAEQAFRCRGRAGRAHRVSRKRGRGLDHRRRFAGRWRLDRALTESAAWEGKHAGRSEYALHGAR
jgi:NAD(P)-dependent dehydrogenase (short-subunit alcohol dehydrogenase family)